MTTNGEAPNGGGAAFWMLRTQATDLLVSRLPRSMVLGTPLTSTLIWSSETETSLVSPKVRPSQRIFWWPSTEIMASVRVASWTGPR